MFEKLSAAVLRQKPSKCEFFKFHITYFRHIVSKDGIETDPKKVTTISEWPVPRTVTEVLGFTNYYWKFIPKYIHIASLSVCWCLERMLVRKEVWWNGLLNASRPLSN